MVNTKCKPNIIIGDLLVSRLENNVPSRFIILSNLLGGKKELIKLAGSIFNFFITGGECSAVIPWGKLTKKSKLVRNLLAKTNGNSYYSIVATYVILLMSSPGSIISGFGDPSNNPRMNKSVRLALSLVKLTSYRANTSYGHGYAGLSIVERLWKERVPETVIDDIIAVSENMDSIQTPWKEDDSWVLGSPGGYMIYNLPIEEVHPLDLTVEELFDMKLIMGGFTIREHVITPWGDVYMLLDYSGSMDVISSWLKGVAVKLIELSIENGIRSSIRFFNEKTIPSETKRPLQADNTNYMKILEEILILRPRGATLIEHALKVFMKDLDRGYTNAKSLYIISDFESPCIIKMFGKGQKNDWILYDINNSGIDIIFIVVRSNTRYTIPTTDLTHMLSKYGIVRIAKKLKSKVYLFDHTL